MNEQTQVDVNDALEPEEPEPTDVLGDAGSSKGTDTLAADVAED